MAFGSFWKTVKEKLRWLDPFTYSDILLKRIDPDNHGAVRFVVELLTAFITAFLLYSIVGLIMGTASPLWIVISGSMEPALHRGDVVLLQGIRSAADIKAQEVTIDQNLEETGLWGFARVNYFVSSGTSVPLGQNVCEQRAERGTYSISIADQTFRLQTDGDIIIYFSRFPNEPPKPIIHRAVLKIHARDGDYFLTKGDSVNNPLVDQDCGLVRLGIPDCRCITLYPIKASEVQGKVAGFVPLIGYLKLILVDDLAQFLSGCPKAPDCPSGCCFP